MEEDNGSSLQTAPKDAQRKTSLQDTIMEEVIYYAYQNDLITDHRLNSFSIAHLFGQLIQSTLPHTDEDGFTDCSDLAEFEIPTPLPLDNTLQVTPPAMRLIRDARHVLSDDDAQQLAEQVCNATSTRSMKLELPILRTDNDSDMRQYHRETLAGHRSLLESIKQHGLPVDEPDVEKGEGMELSPKVRLDCEATMKKLEDEKLAVTKDNLIYLAGQIKDGYTQEDQMRYLVDEIEYDQKPKLEKLTPPVSPKLAQTQFMPAFNPPLVGITSDSSSILSDNFHAIEDAMLKDHQDVWSENTSPIREFLEDGFTISDQDAIWGYPRETLEDLKVEVPLMLDGAPEQLAPSGPNAFGEFVHAEMDLDPHFEQAIHQDFSDGDFEEQLQKAAEQAVKRIEQEQLQAIDAIARVPIPIMDFSIPEPGWTRLLNDEMAIFKWIQSGHEQLFSPPSWPIHGVAQSKLVWSPLGPMTNACSVTETMDEAEPLISSFVATSSENEILSSLDLVRQRTRPITFEDEYEDEEIETVLTRRKSTTDLMDVVRKRSMDVDTGGIRKKHRYAVDEATPDRETQHHGSSLLAGDSPGASAKLLARFMNVHAPKKKTWTNSRYFASQKPEMPTLPKHTDIPQATRSFDINQTQLENGSIQQGKSGPIAPCPTINPPTSPLTIFISIKIPRRMIRVLEGLILGLTLLERNYDAHNTSIWHPGSVIRSEVAPPLADDADITVSPTTGFIITSMIKIRQKPRAGTNKSMVQLRIEKAALRYERLVVLVGGEGGGDDTLYGLSSTDSTALLELQGYVSGLDCNVQVLYLGGGDKTLTNWVAAFICRHSLAVPELLAGLLEVETLWELFLRRAGFNVFAAQVVASQLKQLGEDTVIPARGQHGLSAFVTMTRAERMRRFGQLVGPRVLERVSKAVDELWSQA